MHTTQVAMLNSVHQRGLANTPAAQIITRPGFELWNHSATAASLIEQLCRNVHWYGRNGANAWVWDAGTGGNNGGEPLARGTVNMTNCGGFNMTARWIAHNVLDIDAHAFTGSYTLATDFFITRSGTQVIDRNWNGNVRTLNQDFHQLNAYFFKSHSYCAHAGHLYDASTNVMNFNSKIDLYWCALQILNAATAAANGRVLLVSQRYQNTAIPGAAPYYCVSATSLKKYKQLFPIVHVGGFQGVTQSFINAMPQTTGHQWEAFLLVSSEHLPAPFKQQFTLV